MSYRNGLTFDVITLDVFLTAKGAKIYAKFTRKINYQSLEMVLLYDFRLSTFFSLLSLRLLSFVLK